MLIIQCIILLFLGVAIAVFNEELLRLKASIRETDHKVDRLDNIVQISEQHKRRE